jgi:cobalt-zinc-cadmium efflux system membrane fusion protein
VCEIKEVQVGNSENGFTEIAMAGATTATNFVVKGAYTLLMKMKNSSDE